MRSDIIRVRIHFCPGHHCDKTGGLKRHMAFYTIQLSYLFLSNGCDKAVFNLLVTVHTTHREPGKIIPFLSMYIMAGIAGKVLAFTVTFARHH